MGADLALIGFSHDEVAALTAERSTGLTDQTQTRCLSGQPSR